MRVEHIGERICGLLITGSDVTPVDVKMTPAGIEEHIGSDSFTITYRYLKYLPLAIVYCDEVSKDADLVINDSFQSIYAPILVFKHGRPFEQLSDFDQAVVMDNIEMVKMNGRCVLRLKGLSDTPSPMKGGVSND